MSNANVATEPSMDEILEKIQRSIAVEKGEKEEQSAISITPSIGTPSPEGRPNEPEGKPHKAIEAAAPDQRERLMSPATAGAAVAAFAQVAAIRRQQRRMSEFPMGGEQRTLEDVTRELLKPMMRDWLEEKLVPIVERLVQTELARALGQADGA